MTLRVWLLLICSVGLVSGVLLVPATASVPDARITISEATVSPSAPGAGEPVDVSFTLENSAGSPSAVEIDSVTLRDRSTFGDEYGEIEELGSLSSGDDLTVSLPATFDRPGAYDLELVVVGHDEDGDRVRATRPVSVDVGPDEADIEISAERIFLVETDDGTTEVGSIDELIGSGGGANDAETTPAIELRVSNFGSTTARDVFVQPRVDGENRSRLAVADVPRNGTETVRFETESITEPAMIEFTAAYRLASADPGSERDTVSTTYDYRPGAEALILTDVSMERSGDALSITGNAGNLDTQSVDSAVVAVGDHENVTPAAPQRDYFIGTIPDSDFVTFDLTATVDGEPETIPVEVRYSADGVVYEQTIELPYDATVDDDADSSGVLVVLVVVGLIAAVVAAGVVWRRRGGGGFVWRRQDDDGD